MATGAGTMAARARTGAGTMALGARAASLNLRLLLLGAFWRLRGSPKARRVPENGSWTGAGYGEEAGVDSGRNTPETFVTLCFHVFHCLHVFRRDGEGVRVFWDRLREPSFTSRWNPFATDFPFVTFTHHPVRTVSNSFSDLCDIQKFQEQLRAAAQKVHAVKPVPGKANGVMVLNELIHIETYVGLMSFLGNQNKLGYCMARGNIGF
ncbi:tumor protein p63-regulated gene 1-like protein [Notothenia coriiceps]|uniref:Tumor protein p63-regulated gene 1-like protein n=1 Tax=Notothenia coriiceps TaxID=8208 RepID=A0A6I9NET3_9TELE|nr:PREDICTED: tumor protein p63-regulated gene 1-like protein [Notothenia coriiceps]